MTASFPAERRPLGGVPSRVPAARIVGSSAEIRRALRLATRFAPTDLTVLLIGATGTGKELFARELHAGSGRRGAFIDVNCAALPRDMVESLLFGHRRGAFTGAHADATGLFEAAEGGTLFLDELGSLPLEAQAKLLRVLETGEIRRLGETRSRRVGCRVVAAAQEDLDTRLRTGAFRGDLYQRLAGVVIRLPRLEERREDIIPLARAFATELGRRFSADGEQLLSLHAWPGNVRELRAVVIRAGFLESGEVISRRSLSEALALSIGCPAGPVAGAAERGEDLERTCAAAGWDIDTAARLLQIGRATLYRRLRILGIDPRTRRIALDDPAPGPG